jgi:cbb3-type cytochrome c oxidase subunit III
MRRAWTRTGSEWWAPACLAASLACGGESERLPDAAIATDPYHLPPADTLAPELYNGWKQFRLLCDRCHGEDARGTTFGPDLLPALSADGAVPTREAFIALLIHGRPDRGMPAAATLGLSPQYFDGLYNYLHGRSAGALYGGRPALRER